MSRIRPHWNSFGLATACILLIAACSPAAAPSPTPAPAKPTTAPAAPEKPAAEKPADKVAPAAATKADSVAAKLDEYYQKAKASGEMNIVHYGPGPEYTPMVEAFKQKFPGTTAETVNLRGVETTQRISA